jgi:hypothetical protein
MARYYGERVTNQPQKVDRAMRERFRYSLPYPLAICYKRIGACPDEATRLMYVLKTGEMIARLVGIIAVADLRRSSVPAAHPAEFGRRFGAPSFGTWLWILRESLGALKEAGKTPFVQELPSFVYQSNKQLEELVVIRNRFTHDGVPPDEWLQPRQLPQTCEAATSALEQVLAGLLFLADYQLVVVSPAEVVKKRGKPPRYVREKIVMSGCTDVFDRDKDVSDEICETKEALLIDGSGAYLNLDPLILYSNEGTEERDVDGNKRTFNTEIYDIFLYNGGRQTNRRYLACSKGGDLTSKDASEGEAIEASFTELEQLLGVPA